MSKVSVIIPIYNPGRKLEKCIKSVLNQSFEDFELILVNDGSTDSSLEICRKYEKIDKRLHVIDKKNEGTVATRRRGLEASDSNYIIFVDADDWMDKRMIELLYKEVEKEALDVVVCNTYTTLGNGRIIKRKNNSFYFKENKLYTGEEIKNKLAIAYLHGHPFPAALHGKMYKKELLINNGKYTEGITIIGDDLFYNLEMFLEAHKLKVINIPLYYYRLGGTTSKYMPDLFKDIVLGYQAQINIIKNYYQDTEHANGNGPSIMLLNMFKRCLYGLFLGTLTEDEIKEKISEYVTNESILEASENKGSIKFFPKEFLDAIENEEIDYLYKIGEEIYKSKRIKHGVMNTLVKIPFV